MIDVSELAPLLVDLPRSPPLARYRELRGVANVEMIVEALAHGRGDYEEQRERDITRLAAVVRRSARRKGERNLGAFERAPAHNAQLARRAAKARPAAAAEAEGEAEGEADAHGEADTGGKAERKEEGEGEDDDEGEGEGRSARSNEATAPRFTHQRMNLN